MICLPYGLSKANQSVQFVSVRFVQSPYDLSSVRFVCRPYITKDSLAQLNPKTKKDFKQEGAGKQLLRCLFCALAGKGEHYYDDKMMMVMA